MSKELEALINIGAIFVSCISNEDGDIDYCHLRNHNEYSNWYNTVEKTLKRNEPMKPIKDKENYRCARCHHMVDNHYCSDCGGALDWSDEK